MFTINQSLTLDQIAVLRAALQARIEELQKQLSGRNGTLAAKTIAVAQATEQELAASQNELLAQFGVTAPTVKETPPAPAKRGPKPKAPEAQAQLPGA